MKMKAYQTSSWIQPCDHTGLVLKVHVCCVPHLMWNKMSCPSHTPSLPLYSELTNYPNIWASLQSSTHIPYNHVTEFIPSHRSWLQRLCTSQSMEANVPQVTHPIPTSLSPTSTLTIVPQPPSSQQPTYHTCRWIHACHHTWVGCEGACLLCTSQNVETNILSVKSSRGKN